MANEDGSNESGDGGATPPAQGWSGPPPRFRGLRRVWDPGGKLAAYERDRDERLDAQWDAAFSPPAAPGTEAPSGETPLTAPPPQIPAIDTSNAPTVPTATTSGVPSPAPPTVGPVLAAGDDGNGGGGPSTGSVASAGSAPPDPPRPGDGGGPPVLPPTQGPSSPYTNGELAGMSRYFGALVYQRLDSRGLGLVFEPNTDRLQIVSQDRDRNVEHTEAARVAGLLLFEAFTVSEQERFANWYLDDSTADIRSGVRNAAVATLRNLPTMSVADAIVRQDQAAQQRLEPGDPPYLSWFEARLFAAPNYMDTSIPLPELQRGSSQSMDLLGLPSSRLLESDREIDGDSARQRFLNLGPALGQTPPQGLPVPAAPDFGLGPLMRPLPGQAPVGQQPVGQAPVGQAPVGLAPVGQQPVGQQPVGQQPVGQQPVGQQPVGQQPVGQQPVGQQPVGQQPVGQQPVGQQPVGQQPVGQQPVGQQPVGQQPVGQQPVGQQPVGQQPVGQQPVGQQPVGQQPVGQQPVGQQPVGQQPVGQQPVGQQPVGQQPVGQQPVGQQPVGQQPVGQQPVGQQPVGQQPVGQQPVGQQPVGQQPVGQQPVGQQPAGAPGIVQTGAPGGIVGTGQPAGGPQPGQTGAGAPQAGGPFAGRPPMVTLPPRAPRQNAGQATPQQAPGGIVGTGAPVYGTGNLGPTGGNGAGQPLGGTSRPQGVPLYDANGLPIPGTNPQPPFDTSLPGNSGKRASNMVISACRGQGVVFPSFVDATGNPSDPGVMIDDIVGQLVARLIENDVGPVRKFKRNASFRRAASAGREQLAQNRAYRLAVQAVRDPDIIHSVIFAHESNATKKDVVAIARQFRTLGRDVNLMMGAISECAVPGTESDVMRQMVSECAQLLTSNGQFLPDAIRLSVDADTPFSQHANVGQLQNSWRQRPQWNSPPPVGGVRGPVTDSDQQMFTKMLNGAKASRYKDDTGKDGHDGTAALYLTKGWNVHLVLLKVQQMNQANPGAPKLSQQEMARLERLKNDLTREGMKWTEDLNRFKAGDFVEGQSLIAQHEADQLTEQDVDDMLQELGASTSRDTKVITPADFRAGGEQGLKNALTIDQRLKSAIKAAFAMPDNPPVVPVGTPGRTTGPNLSAAHSEAEKIGDVLAGAIDRCAAEQAIVMLGNEVLVSNLSINRDEMRLIQTHLDNIRDVLPDRDGITDVGKAVREVGSNFNSLRHSVANGQVLAGP